MASGTRAPLSVRRAEGESFVPLSYCHVTYGHVFTLPERRGQNPAVTALCVPGAGKGAARMALASRYPARLLEGERGTPDCWSVQIRGALARGPDANPALIEGFVATGAWSSSEYGTYKTVKARFWPWLSGKSP